MAYVLALDQGTTSSRAILFDHDGGVRSVAQREFEQIFPQTGFAFWRDAGAIATMPVEEKHFEPRMPRSRFEALHGRWTQALSRAKGWDANPQE